MKNFFLPIFVITLFGCNKQTLNDTEISELANDTEISESASALQRRCKDITTINFTEPNLFPEGIEYDRHNDRFLVSSVTRGDIGIVNERGDYEVFIDDPALTSTTGLEINKSRNLLYVANAPGSVGVYHLNNGTRRRLINLAALLPSAPIFVNDIALDPQGNAYVTNSFSPVIYKITPDGTASIFFQNNAFATLPGQFGFNGIVYGNSNGGYLLVAFSRDNKIIKIPINNTSAFSDVMLDAPLAGPDGLLLSKDGKQLSVVNNAGGSSAGKVQSFISTDKWHTASLANSYPTGAVFPTTATSDGKDVFVLYAYLHLRATGRDVFTIQKVPLYKTNSY